MPRYPLVPGENPKDRRLRIRREAKQRRRAANPQKAKEEWLKYKHNITLAEWNTMVEEQNGLCAACREAPPINVDHNHKTGKRRGALCWACNIAVGHLRDDPQRARRLADYLERHQT